MNHTRIKQAIADIEEYEAALNWLKEFGKQEWKREEIKVNTFGASACNGHKQAMDVLSAYAFHALPEIIEASIKACQNTIETSRDIIREECA